MSDMRQHLLPIAVALGLVAASCESPGPTGPGTGGPSIRTLTQEPMADTVQAVATTTLVVEVRDSAGAPFRGEVGFRALNPRREPAISLCSAGTPASKCTGWWGALDSLDVETDSEGRAAVQLARGTVADTVSIRISVTSLALSDSAAAIVLPGAPTQLVLGVRDSTAYVGGSYAIGASTRDRLGNITAAPGPFTYSSLGSAASVDGSGVLHAVAIGRSGAVVRTGSLEDTAWISVPPRGTIAAVLDNYTGESVVVRDLDGSDSKVVGRPGAHPYYGVWPAWSSRGEVAFESGDERILVADTSGAIHRATGEDSTTHGEVMAAFAPDGSILFSARGGSNYGLGIWRVSSPGSVPVHVGPNPHGNANNWKLSPSPDGVHVVYMSVDRGMSIMDVRDGTTVTLRTAGDLPRWSPGGDWIAFCEGGALYRIHPDGSGLSRVSPDRGYYGASWSPDEQWLVASNSGGLELVRVSSGEVLPLRWSGGMSAPAWKPE
jgi:hypothetical protein